MHFAESLLLRVFGVVLISLGFAAFTLPTNPAIRLLHQVLDELKAVVESLPMQVF